MALIRQPDKIIVKRSYLDQSDFVLYFHQGWERWQRRQHDRIHLQTPGGTRDDIVPRGHHLVLLSIHGMVVGLDHLLHSSFEWEPNEYVAAFREDRRESPAAFDLDRGRCRCRVVQKRRDETEWTTPVEEGPHLQISV